MSSFTEPLTLTKLKDGLWKVDRAFKYYVGEDGSDDIISIKKGFITDGASIPRPFFSLIGGPMGEYVQSAVVHDYGYQIMERPRKEVDKIFLEGMKVLGVSFWKRHIMYRAVRMNLPAEIRWRKHGANKKD